MSSEGSKYKKYKKLKRKNVYKHTHCPVCKRMVPKNSEYGEFCSADCANSKKNKKKKKKKRIIFMVGGYILLFGVLIGLSFILG